LISSQARSTGLRHLSDLENQRLSCTRAARLPPSLVTTRVRQHGGRAGWLTQAIEHPEGTAARHALEETTDGLSAVDDHHLPAGLVGLHDAMRFADLLEAEDPGGLRIEAPGRHLFGDLLERHVGERELRSAEHEAAEEGQVDAAGHLEERIEVGDRRESSQPAREAGATP